MKKHGCKTWREYHRRYDPDINSRANKIKHIYHGYPYVYGFENRLHQIYCWDLDYDGSREIIDWCEKNCQGKFRYDFFRVNESSTPTQQWEIDEISGRDYYFAAFKNEEDYFLFKLRWA